MPKPDLRVPERSPVWKWWVCGLLLLATIINYLDRQTFSQLADEIKFHLSLDAQDYGNIEAVFALAFAGGAILLGWLVDRWTVFWVYPLAVIGWSMAGFATGFVTGFWGMLVCRFLLGLTEAANWPCALKTTQRILTPAERSLGNSIFQSGTAIGAILTPLIILGISRDPATWEAVFWFWPETGETHTWRYPFWLIGIVGMFWAVLWWLSIRRADVTPLPDDPAVARSGVPLLPRRLAARRFVALVVLVISVNIPWHFYRAWMPQMLRSAEYGSYTKEEVAFITMGYYLAADAGSLSAGFLALFLTRRMTVHRARMAVYFCYALLVLGSFAVAVLPRGTALILTLMGVAFGTLGVFPIYYAFSQELSRKHQGKVSGALGASNWIAMAMLQSTVGAFVKNTGTFRGPIAAVGITPLIGWAVLLWLWGKDTASPADSDETRRP